SSLDETIAVCRNRSCRASVPRSDINRGEIVLPAQRSEVLQQKIRIWSIGSIQRRNAIRRWNANRAGSSIAVETLPLCAAESEQLVLPDWPTGCEAIGVCIEARLSARSLSAEAILRRYRVQPRAGIQLPR